LSVGFPVLAGELRAVHTVRRFASLSVVPSNILFKRRRRSLFSAPCLNWFAGISGTLTRRLDDFRGFRAVIPDGFTVGAPVPHLVELLLVEPRE